VKWVLRQLQPFQRWQYSPGRKRGLLPDRLSPEPAFPLLSMRLLNLLPVE